MNVVRLLLVVLGDFVLLVGVLALPEAAVLVHAPLEDGVLVVEVDQAAAAMEEGKPSTTVQIDWSACQYLWLAPSCALVSTGLTS